MVRQKLKPDEVSHGTLTGYSWHRHWKENPCEACKKAKRDYSRNAARAKKEAELQEAPRKQAWQRACARLADEYPARFREILTEEMRGLVTIPPEDEGTE